MTTQTYDTDPKQKLYDTVKGQGLYTKSFDEFKAKYSTPEAIDNLYNVVSKTQLYTKSKDEFLGKYFAEPVEKKSKVGGSSPLQSSGEGLKEASMDDLKAFVTGKTVEEVKATKQANLKPPAKITNAITQTTTQKPTQKSIDEEANFKIEQIADEDFTDPIKGINKLSQANPTNARDILATQKAKDILLSRMAADGFDAKELLNRSFFGAGDENNQTTRELRAKEQQYDKSVAPLRDIPVDTDLSQANEMFIDYNYKDRLYSAAVQAHAEKNPSFKKELEVSGIDPTNTRDLVNQIPNGKMGLIVQEYLSDPNVSTYLQKENPALLPAFQQIQKNILKDNPDFAINEVANKVSREVQKSGFNNIDPVFNFYGENHREFADQIAKSTLSPEELEVWNKSIRDNQEKYMDAPSFFQGFAEAGGQFSKGIANTFTQPFTSVPETIKENWKKEASHVSANPEGLMKVIRDSGHAAGIVSSIGAASTLGGGLGLSSNAASMTALGVGFLGDNLEIEKLKYPDSPVKQWTSALFNTGLYMAMGKNIFPQAKVKQAFENIRPDVNKIVENLSSGKITREAARQEANTLLKKGIDFLGGTLKENTKIAAELTGIGILDRYLDKVMGLEDTKFKQYHSDDQDTETFKTMFLSNALVAGLSKYGQMRRGNKIVEESLYEAATNEKRFERIINDLEIKDPTVKKEELLANLKFVADTKRRLDDAGIVDPKNQKRYLFEALRDRTNTNAIPKDGDATIVKKAKEENKESQEIKERILAGEDADTIITEREKKEIEETEKQQQEVSDAANEIENLNKQREIDNKSFDLKRKDLDGRNPEDKIKIEKIEQQRAEKNQDYDQKIIEAHKKVKESSSTPMEAATEGAAENVVPSTSVIMPGEIQRPETTVISPKENVVEPKAKISVILPKSETKETTTQVPDQTKATITEPSEPNKAGEGAGGEPPIKPPKVDEGNAGDGMRDLDKLANNVPDSGKVAEYMSKETIEKYTGETPTNDQRRGVQELEIALNHGEKIIEKAQTVFGKDYVDKTLDYIESSTAPVSNKALMYVSLENALGREKLLSPERAADITKQQALVYEQSQKFARENSLALNYQKLRRIAKVGYDIEKITDSFFSPEELIAKENIKKAVEADADAINKEAEKQEAGGMTPDVEKLVQEGVEKEIAKIYEQLPKDKKTMADKAIAALEAVQKKLRGKTYDAGLGIPVAIVDAGITTVKLAIKAGVKVADAIELGINKIKEKWGKEWPKEDEFRKDLAEAFKNVKSTTEFVKEALIEKGFGRETTIKGEKKTILDWKKLAGKAGTVSKISENVAEAMKDKKMPTSEVEAMKDALVNEYINLRTSVIEKAQTELARRNKETVTPEQKSAARKLAELYTLGGFEGKEGEFDNAINKAFGAKVNEKDYSEAREIAKAMETIYTTTFKGAKLNDISGKAAIEKLEDRLRVLLFRGARQEGNTNLKIATMVRNYFELQQTLVLNNLKQAVENPLSGLQQNVISMIEGATSKEGQGTAAMADQRRKMMKTVYRDMVTKGGIGYGKTESTFVNRQHIDDFINKLSDNQLYHGIASVATGKTTLNAMDAMWKVGLTEKKFASNLIKVLTHETNKNKMSKDEAQKFVSEQLTGQTFKDAQKTATELIQKINKEAGKDLIPLHKQQVDRLANDIVKAALEMGGKITKEQIDAAFNAAYRSASLNLGHTANNFLSAMIHGQSAKIEGALNQAIKNKEWDRAAWLTYYSVFYRNILNPFVGGGTNWLVIKFEKTGLGLVTGLIYKKGTKTDLDLSTERGLKLMEDRLYNQSRIKDQYMRGLIGGITTWTAYAAFLGLAGTDDYRKWRANNPWAARYLDIVTPEPMLAHMAVENDAVKRYVSQSLNKNDAFDASGKLIKAADYFVKGKTNEGWGALGEMTGMKFNAPLPWRLVKDLQVLYQGIVGQDPYHGNYKPSTGFFNGLLQGGVIEYLGFRPEGSGVTPKAADTKKQSKSNKKTEKKQTKAN